MPLVSAAIVVAAAAAITAAISCTLLNDALSMQPALSMQSVGLSMHPTQADGHFRRLFGRPRNLTRAQELVDRRLQCKDTPIRAH